MLMQADNYKFNTLLLWNDKVTQQPTVEQFRNELVVHDIEVHGIWFGSRGAQH